MIYFDSDMSKSTNMVVYCDWKTEFCINPFSSFREEFGKSGQMDAK